MLKTLRNMLMVVVALLMAIQPAVACCFVASADFDQSVTSVEQTPCHGGATAAKVPVEPSEPPCPECGDCSAVMMASDHANDPAVTISQCEDEEPAPIARDSAANPVPRLTVIPIRPGHSEPRSAQTPISLKQRLLV